MSSNMQKDVSADVLEQGEAPVSDETGAQAQSGKDDAKGISRRGLCIGVGGIAALGIFGSLRYIGHNPLVHPPGGADESHLISACVRCEKCYEACPRKIIQPSHIEDGLLGMRAPKLNFDSNYCDFCGEENGGVPRCVMVCPTNALKLGAGEANADGSVISDEDASPAADGSVQKKPLIILGKAAIDTNTCMAYRQTGCRKCYDNCPYGAISLNTTSSELSNPLPVVDTDKCNGCGACESVCISLTAGSIVEGATERAIKVRPLSEV